MRSRAVVLVAAVLGAPGTACGPGSTEPVVEEIEGLPRPLTSMEDRVARASGDFAFDLLDAVYRSAPGESAFTSPLSASMALGMLMNGARGETLDQIRGMLGWGNASIEEINAGVRGLIDLLRTLDPAVEFSIANSIWHRPAFPVRADFLERTRNAFDARTTALDFSLPAAAGTINAWVREQTRGRIETIVEPPIDPLVVLYLINAVYFRGDWATKFEVDRTRPAPFTPESGPPVDLPFMERTLRARHAQTADWQAVDLAYGGKAFSMTLILPGEGGSVAGLLETLRGGGWRPLLGALRESEGSVAIPRFEFAWRGILTPVLQELGMMDAFVPGRADLSGMSDAALATGLHVSDVIQKSWVRVDEEGTEAAAVTSIEVRVTSIPVGFDFRADRPFVYLIRERFSDTVLFAGVFAQP